MQFEQQRGSPLPLKPGSLRVETVVDGYLEPKRKRRTLELGRAKHHLSDRSALSLNILRSETEASRSRKRVRQKVRVWG